jgi:hypothetical protein
MAFGSKDARGIYKFGEDDTETSFSALLNKGMNAVSDATKFFSGTPAQRDALTPAPAGAQWQDTDTSGRLWKGVSGVWVILEGTQRGRAAVKAGAAASTNYTVTVTFPKAFASAPTVVACADSGSTVGSMIVAVGTITTTNFKLSMSANLAINLNARWIAVGS